MSKHNQIPEGEDGQAPFAEMLRVCDIELLIRLRHRLKRFGRKRMVQILTEEIKEREQFEEHQLRIQMLRPQEGSSSEK